MYPLTKDWSGTVNINKRKKMKAGLYAVTFRANSGNYGGGVVFIENSRIHGGDLGYAYFGKYQESGNSFTAQLTIRRYNPSAQSIFGSITEFQLSLHGNSNADGFTVEGSIAGQPNAKIQIGAKKIGDAVP